MYDLVRIGCRMFLGAHDDAPWARVLATVTRERAERLGFA